MVPRSLLVCSALLAVSTFSRAQEVAPVESVVTRVEFEQFKSELKDTLDQLSAKLVQLNPAVGQSAGASGVVEKESCLESLKTLEQRIAALESSRNEMLSIQHEQGTILGQIATKNEAGNFHVRIDANSQPAINELQRALQRTVPSSGQFIIRNRAGRNEYVIVNGYQHLVLANATLSLPVRPGTVTAQLPGQQVVSWYVGLPDYRQTIEIVREVVPVSAARRVSTNAPVYYVGTLGQTGAF